MAKSGALLVISGFSGVGKGTVVGSLRERYEEYALSVSATTRQPRAGEVHGREYYFCSESDFQGMIGRGDLIEYTSYCDHFYGTPRPFVEDNLKAGRDVILEIEIQGARNIRRQYPDALLVFLMPPSAEELLRRLSGRGTETPEIIRQRLERAVAEAEGIEDYDYVFVNDEPYSCAERIHSLVLSRRARTKENLDFIEEIRTQLKEFAKGE